MVSSILKHSFMYVKGEYDSLGLHTITRTENQEYQAERTLLSNRNCKDKKGCRREQRRSTNMAGTKKERTRAAHRYGLGKSGRRGYQYGCAKDKEEREIRSRGKLSAAPLGCLVV